MTRHPTPIALSVQPFCPSLVVCTFCAYCLNFSVFAGRFCMLRTPTTQLLRHKNMCRDSVNMYRGSAGCLTYQRGGHHGGRLSQVWLRGDRDVGLASVTTRTPWRRSRDASSHTCDRGSTCRGNWWVLFVGTWRPEDTSQTHKHVAVLH